MVTLKAHSQISNKEASSPTLGDIFRRFGEQFRSEHRLHPRQHKVMYDIEHCRQGQFGTHWEVCDTCGHMTKGYNSCRNRHCPGCNNIARQKWVEARTADLLPVSYHHSVFTLPHVFNHLCSYNRQVMYDLLFEASSQTLLDFGHNPKRLGATIGFYGILHTWGGKLWPHPHVHYIVTAGGINQKNTWVTPRNDDTFLFPVKALSNVFRAKFLEGLIHVYDKGLLKLPDELSYLEDKTAFRQWLYHEVPKKWVVFSKPPFSGPDEVVKYIGRYTHRCAISNNRIIDVKNGMVAFWFKNTKKNARWETTSLPVMNFIERFLYHVLPKHFHRIRYYGFLANGKARSNIEAVLQSLGGVDPVETEPDNGVSCPNCNSGTMITLLITDGHGNIVSDNLTDDTKQLPAILLDTT